MLKRLNHLIFITLLSTLLFACGGGGGGTPAAQDSGNGGGNSETTAPTSTILPSAPALITSSTPIVITFDQTMNTASLSLSGAMTGDGGLWSSVNMADDTLTVSPQPQWELGDQILIFNAQNTTGLEAGSQMLTYTVDDMAPILNLVPASGSAIQNNIAITLSFSESIDINSFSSSGSLWDESDQGIWSNTTNSNDTLTLMPDTIWADGMKTIIIDATDLAGNALATQIYNYLVDSSTTVVNPMSGSTLSQSSPIVITFSKSMDVTTLAGSGSIWNDSDKGIWSSDNKANDILTLSPAIVWSLAPYSLSLSVTDVFGETQTITANYSVGCPTGMVNCNGACTNLSADINNCGVCNTACGAQANTNDVVCAAGSCTIQTCASGFDDCNNRYADGCEANLTTDITNCGSCNIKCSDSVSCTRDFCVAGSCNSSPEDSLCADIVTYGACQFQSTTCAEIGFQTGTVTPGVCSYGGCSTGTPYTNTRSCSRSTNGNSCSTGVCNNGRCVECRLDSDCRRSGDICLFGRCGIAP